MGRYNIRIYYPRTRQEGFEEVKGYPVSIPWIEGVELFAHRPYNSNSSWNISEAKTGLALIEYCIGTKSQAIEALKSKLASIKTDNITQWLKDMIKAYLKDNKITNPVALGGKG